MRRNSPLTILRLAEPKKEKTDGAAQNGALSPNGDPPQHVGQPPGVMEATPPAVKPERPSSLGHGKQLTKRLLCYHSEHCKYGSLVFFLSWSSDHDSKVNHLIGRFKKINNVIGCYLIVIPNHGAKEDDWYPVIRPPKVIYLLIMTKFSIDW